MFLPCCLDFLEKVSPKFWAVDGMSVSKSSLHQYQWLNGIVARLTPGIASSETSVALLACYGCLIF